MAGDAGYRAMSDAATRLFEIVSSQIIKYGCPVCNNYDAKWEHLIIVHMSKEHTMKEIEDACG